MQRVRLIILSTALILALMSVSSVAMAQTGGSVEPPGIGGEQLGRDVSPSSQERSTSEGTLPFTGADLTLFLAIGVGAIATGTVMIRRTRKAGSV